MKYNRLIHTYTEPETAWFRFTFYLLTMALGLLLGTAFIIGPVILFMNYQSIWLLLYGVFIPLGFWMNHRIFLFMKKIWWHYHHISCYKLFPDKIETIEWPSAHCPTPVEQKIPLKSISTVVASPYILRQTMTEYGGKRIITETAPILFILYTEKEQSRLLKIPFANHEDPAINIWLCHFKEQLVPIDFTARFLFRKNFDFMNNRQRIEVIETPNELIPFSFSGDWQTDYPFAWEAWNEKRRKQQQTEETKIPDLTIAHLKHSKKDWFITLLIVFKVMIVSATLLIELEKGFPISSYNLLPGFVIFMMGAFLFFYLLKRHLRWFYMLTFSLMVLAVAIFSCTFFKTGGGMAENISIAALLFPILVWIPYLTVKWATSKQTNRNMKEVEI